MPQIVREGDRLPDWCRLRSYSILPLKGDGTQVEPPGPKARLVSCGGSVNVRLGNGSQVIGNGQFIDFSPDDAPISVTPVQETGLVVLLSGEWEDELGGCGVFTAVDVEDSSDRGDPVSYHKSTMVDSHYHDCDEYWILLEGSATVVVDGEAAGFTPGDCLCIGMGRHHDMPHAPKPVRAVFFETGLEREKRVGHLWEHTHGPAVLAEGRD